MITGDILVSPSLSVSMRDVAFKYSRSGGPGGQHVNKTETRVELIFNVAEAPSLGPYQREVLMRVLAPRLDSTGAVHIVCSESRSQLQNKSRTVEQLATMLAGALKPRKKRTATKPTRASKERRITEKKIIGQRKKLRSGRSDE